MQVQTRPEGAVDDDVEARVRRWLAAYRGPGHNVAGLLCDRHAGAPERLALRYEDAAGQESRLSYAALREASMRFAGLLRQLGVTRGESVAILLPRSPELLIATIGIWRLGAVHVPLFTAFGPQAISYRARNSGTRVVVTDSHNRGKVETANGVRVVTVGRSGEAPPVGDVPFWPGLEAAEPMAVPASLRGDDPLILAYTSGSTGHPNGVPVPVEALAPFEAYMRFGLDVRDDDVFWNIADPGWAYGLFYGLVGPLLLGQTILYVNAPFDPQTTYRVLARYGVTNFTGAPTVYRALRAAGPPPTPLHLRALSSAGEPLNPDVIAWASEHLGVPIYDHYGQTELGMVVNNHQWPALRRPLRPGSMGHAMPGFRVAVLDDECRELGPGPVGQLAIDLQHSPCYTFRGYSGDATWTASRFSADGRYYLTGDAVRRDDDGYLFFSSRADDIITSAGYRIGPFEIESALVGHPAVAEAAAVGIPDALRGDVVKAYVVLRPGYAGTDELKQELSQHVKLTLSAHAYPRQVAFVEQLPKTPSGKIQRFLLREESRRHAV